MTRAHLAPVFALLFIWRPALAAPGGFDLHYQLEWDGSMSGSSLSFPRWAAVSSSGDVFVSDNTRIQKFDSNGGFLQRIGESGVGDGQFLNPNGLAADRMGQLYCAEHAWNHRVQRFTTDGVYLGKWGSVGNGDGQFQSPQGVAVVAGTFVYVADRANHRIQKFGATGDFLVKWGAPGGAPGDFDRPTGIAVDSRGGVYVSDSGNHRIQKFDSEGDFLAAWGGHGVAAGQLDTPRGLAVGAGDVIWVADEGNHRVQLFSSAGAFLGVWGAGGGDGSSGSGPGEFLSPHGVAVDGTFGNLYVVEVGNHRVQKFSVGTAVESATWARIKGGYR